MKRRRALLESNPARDSQARAGECSRARLGRRQATEAHCLRYSFALHASQNSSSTLVPASGVGSGTLRGHPWLSACHEWRLPGFRRGPGGQQPPSIRIGLTPSPIPYALLNALGKPGGKRPIFATASRTLARAYCTARFSIPTSTFGFLGSFSLHGLTFFHLHGQARHTCKSLRIAGSECCRIFSFSSRPTPLPPAACRFPGSAITPPEVSAPRPRCRSVAGVCRP